MKNFKAKILAEIFSELSKNKISYCVLRNYDKLPSTVESKDVDMLVEKKYIKKVRKIIDILVKRYDEIIFEHELYEYVEFFRIYFGIDCLKIDCAFNYDAKLITFITGKEILKYKKLHESNFYYLDETMSACIALHKNLFIVKRINIKYIDFIYKEYFDDKLKFIKYLKILVGPKNTAKLVKYLDVKKIESSQTLANNIIKYSKSIQKRRIAKIFRKISHIRIEIIRRLQRGKRNLISLHGPDGAGKSTVAEMIKPMLAKAFCIDESDVIIKHFRPYVLPNISVLLSNDKQKAQESIEENISNPHEAEPAGFFSSILRLAYYSFDYMIGFWVKVFPLTSRGKIVIFDRYYLDYYVDSLRSRINVPKFFISLLSIFIVKPFASFALIGDEEIYYSRKKELDKEEIKRQVHEYTILSKKKKYFFGINGEGKPEEVASDILVEYIKKRCKVI